jgi:large subunit ribosomal protein L17e
MVKYSREPQAGAAIKTAKARASDLRTSFKNMRETAMAIKNLPLAKARAYLNRVLDHKSCVPLRRFNGSAGRCPQTKEHNFSGPGRFPEKSVKHLLDLLTNAESNAESKELDSENLHITHIQVRAALFSCSVAQGHVESRGAPPVKRATGLALDHGNAKRAKQDSLGDGGRCA